MTPYSLAFTTIRLIAVLMLSIGAYQPIGVFIQRYIVTDGDYPSNFSFVMHQVLLTVLPGLLLYVLAHWLAKAAVWKIKA